HRRHCKDDGSYKECWSHLESSIFCLHRGILPENTATGQPAIPDTIPYPKNSVKNYMSDKIGGGRVGLRSGCLSSRLIPHRHRPRAELQPAHELQVDTLR